MTTEPIAIVEQGQIKGKILKGIRNNSFLAFLGVPYAKPPVGDLRFRDPQPPLPWQGILDCTEEGNCCFSDQFVIEGADIKLVETGSEDCLVLNVFTHQLNEDNRQPLKPVMFWVHGGGFSTGSSSTVLYGPEILLTEDIVLVSLNYRLGALGFLSIKDQHIGNAGLKDQLQALRWINQNISRFGGDPDNVTIFGESAGGASTQHQVLSPLTKGLIHKAIAQSGSVLNPWARGREDNGYALAEALGFTETDGGKVLQFLQSLPAARILEGQRKLDAVKNGYNIRYFAPTIEAQSDSSFISEDRVQLIRSGRYNHIPYMTGYTSQEGLLVPLFPPMGMDIPYEDLVPFILGYNEGADDSKYEEAKRQISRFYFGRDEPDEANKTAFYNIYSDNQFVRGVYVSAKAFAKTQPVYLYKVTVETALNEFKPLVKTTEPGVSHGDELGYLFKSSATPQIEPGSIEDKTMRKFVKLWTNFARVGNPTPETDQLLDNVVWKPLDVEEMNYLEIGQTLKIDTDIDAQRMQFWDELLKSVPGN